MQRRDFVKLMAAGAPARTIRAKGQPALSAPAGFNKIHRTYEEFCATPESKRIFQSQQTAANRDRLTPSFATGKLLLCISSE